MRAYVSTLKTAATAKSIVLIKNICFIFPFASYRLQQYETHSKYIILRICFLQALKTRQGKDDLQWKKCIKQMYKIRYKYYL